ncbi:hypothetical protein EXM22_14040 [Oceanispirochaeta crateris]|uniref:Bacterial surface antigen (D15) domain-containing protein n=1 Tax=Oceanispirochaeta crateris TaxID=2518645 RepID=A0A5C1QR11_9SPIO|nr:hypothetical protein [Oceanispirochaeta crateris]QEN09054.1 hypothetical protein EXM22_14040 [Oceanispirochaeta crateris]
MRLKKLIQTLLLFSVIVVSVNAQFSPGVDWKKIESDHFLLIFPEEIHEQAMKIVKKAEMVYQKELGDFGTARESKWPLILTTSGMVSNGYVTLAPRKSVWFGTPAAEGLSSLDWYDLLNLHETRHMVQMDHMNQGFIRFLYFFGGELGLTAGIYLSVPSWYLEGDAVAAETMYSSGGRGRDPLFYSQMKVLALNENFSYQKFVNRSYRHYIPNQYAFGYFMASYISRKYGEESWNKILKTTATLPLPAFGLYLGAKRVTGKSWTSLFQDMMKELKEYWEAEQKTLVLTENESILSEEQNVYTNYETLFADENEVLARKTSLDEPPSLVRINLEEGEEEYLFRISAEGKMSSNGRIVAWTWNRPSPLHSFQNWSDLVFLDIKTGKKTFLTRKARYLSPAFSVKGDLLAVIHWRTDLKAEIHILDGGSGALKDVYFIPFDGFPASPSWSEDDETLYFTLQGEQGRGIALLNLKERSFTMIQDFSMETVKNIRPWKNYLLYQSNLSGFENIMALDLDSLHTFQVSSRPYGVQAPYVYAPKSTLYYSDTRGINGNSIVKQDLNPDTWVLTDRDEQFIPYSPEGDWSIHDFSESKEMEKIQISEIQDYSLIRGKFNIHSWGISPNLESMTGLRFQVQSTDVMETMNWATGAEYEINEKKWGSFLDIDWVRSYPVLSMRNSSFYRTIDGVDLWDISSTLGFYFPMNLKRDSWYYFVNPGVSTGLRAFLPLGGSGADSYVPLNPSITAYALLPGSFRSIYPQWGAWQRAGSYMNPSEINESYQIYSDSRFYIPGLFKNNSLSLRVSLEEQSGQYSLPFLFVRGYDSQSDYRTAISSVQYDFPLLYPDLAGGSFAYIQRMRAAFFFDFAEQMSQDRSTRTFQSIGTELTFDMTLANQRQGPFSLGFRFVWLVEEERPVFQLVFANASL